MHLPNAGIAIVEERKINGYLLSPEHPRGAAKAAFFARFGFLPIEWTVLRDALIEHANSNMIYERASTPFGDVFEVNGRIKSPDGRNPWVRVVWFIRTGEEIPRLVTAIPSKGFRP